MKTIITIACASAAALFHAPGWAQSAAGSYPSRPVTIVIPVAAGGPTDTELRLYAKKLNESLGQSFLLDNKPGAGSVIGTQFVARSPADGYTLLVIAGNFTVIPATNKDLPFDTLKDFAPISLMSEQPKILVVTPGFPAKTFAEYVAFAKANPGKISLGTSGQGGVNHLMNVWMHTLTGTTATNIPYKGSAPMLVDLLGGRLNGAAIPIGDAMRHSKAGKLRALGTTAANRTKLWPDLPTIKEQGLPLFSYTSWVGIGAPAATPQPVITKLSEHFAKAAKAPDIAAALEPDGWVMVGSTPAQFRQLIVTETERWKKVVEENGITAE
jgi:tripartite-type tricarboxylate transporter receptor subunit TctC